MGPGWDALPTFQCPARAGRAPIAFSERLRRENDPLDAREIDDGIQVSFTTGEVSDLPPVDIGAVARPVGLSQRVGVARTDRTAQTTGLH